MSKTFYDPQNPSYCKVTGFLHICVFEVAFYERYPFRYIGKSLQKTV
jgi:hypothetical protein